MSDVNCHNIIKEIENLFPIGLAMEFDNTGLLIGSKNANIKKIFLCLEATKQNISDALDYSADLIISHHPIIFTPIKKIVDTDYKCYAIIKLIENKTSFYCAHTNFDIADKGLNDILAKKIGLKDIKKYNSFIGRIGILENEKTLEDFAKHIKKILNCKALRFIGNKDSKIKKVAVCSGSGANFIENIFSIGTDVYLTSDIRHHDAILASELNLNIIDAGHFETENLFCDFMFDFLTKKFPKIEIIKSKASGFFNTFD
ncbi:MAG: Nif3-like dinuclear metal center hexameric protein [Clostridiales bacterium]|jgi:dinuclear metal center YbgI/SA1388 family protein|nr:Nif3-like dinuclear metal center hexameric protein [Clostridiales bacterium]